MRGISMGCSDPRPCSGKKTLRRCKNSEEVDNVILIDGDSEHYDNVIFIDITESFPKKKQSSARLRKEKQSFRNVIYIDDDETCDEDHPVDANNASFFAGNSSNKEPYRASQNFADSSDDTVEECEFVHDKTTPVRLSKCKRTYSGKTSMRNRYGFDTDSERDSSDDEYPDCELVEDSSGNVHKMWEKAFSRRRKGIGKSDSGIRDHNNISHDIGEDPHQDVEMEDASRKHMEASFCFSDKISKIKNDANSASRRWNTNFGCTTAYDTFTPHGFSESVQKTELHHSNSDVHNKSNSESEEGFTSIYVGRVDIPDCKVRDCNIRVGEGGKSVASSSSTHREESSKGFDRPTTSNNKKVPPVESCPKIFDSCSANNSCVGGSSHGENGQPAPKIPTSANIPINETKLHEDDSFSNDQLDSKQNGQLHNQNADTFLSDDTSIINEREKLKETDEYKKALEEEWASRQQALASQAEEAQRQRRLLKRLKAENMRILDMEKRQKQRIEEMRNTQKKDEENMNLKEEIRAEVRKELNKLEITCHSMASLLHLLGIQVGGWPNPSPEQVQIGYKRALLTFHPDRSSRSDIRQQVEAEEKFKLINRVKEKF